MDLREEDGGPGPQAPSSEQAWFEVWTEAERRGATPYVLLLLYEDELYTVFDPARRAVALETPEAADARAHLQQRGFQRVEGRTGFATRPTPAAA
ncbi:MAG: hypothetical protein AAFR16_01715 [Pseudomonadota bacterium]